MTAALVAPEVREGFTTITPYVRVKNAGLIEFIARTFGAEETFSARGSAGGVHREVRIGDSMIMIGEGGAEDVMPARPVAFHVYVEDVDAAFQRALEAGGVSLGTPAERPYGERAGFIRDPFGNHWYVATHLGPGHVAPGLRTVTPFLHVREAAQYIGFLQRAFGAEEEGRHDVEGHVQYARLRIGNAAIELGEAQRDFEPMPGSFYLYVRDPDVLYQRALEAGGKSVWPPAKQPYGERVAAVEDATGSLWFLARPEAT